jgi:hypothetical protein
VCGRRRKCEKEKVKVSTTIEFDTLNILDLHEYTADSPHLRVATSIDRSLRSFTMVEILSGVVVNGQAKPQPVMGVTPVKEEFIQIPEVCPGATHVT